MVKKRQVALAESSATNGAKKMVKPQPLTFDEIVSIIQSGDSQKLKEIIESGKVKDINMIGASTETLLMVACKSGFVECARVLIDNHANINYIANVVGSVLRSACLSGNMDMVRFLIEQGVVINDQVIFCLLREREIVCKVEVATTLIGYIQNVNYVYEHQSMLYQACYSGEVNVVRMLLERGARLDDHHCDPLVGACSLGRLDIVKLLLSWSTNNGRISVERLEDALEIASRLGFIEVVRCLVEYGTDASALNSSLYEAIDHHQLEIAAFLLDNGADFNDASTQCSAWVYACRYGYSDMVRLFLDRGADPNTVDARGKSPLRASLKDLQLLSILLERGADPNIRFSDGSTALLQLIQRMHGDFMQALAVLFEHGANPNISYAATGETPLMKAALMPRVDLVKLLLEHGADVTQVNREGKSVLDMLGRTRRYSKVVDLCTSYIESNKPGAKLLLK